jgi:hypothetical protein
MKIKYYNTQTHQYEDIVVAFWKEGKKYCCAVPRDDFATQQGFHWKKYGLIGRGKTKEEALDDWKVWKNASDFVAAIY